MVTSFPPLNIAGAAGDGVVGQFRRLTTTLSSSPDGSQLLQLDLPAEQAVVEWLHPFSWDAEFRGVVTAVRTLRVGEELCLHSGPYGTADAVAHRDGHPMRFPDQGDGHRYLSGDAPGQHEDHQDAAAWILVHIADQCLVLAWEYSGSMINHVTIREDRLHLSSTLPGDTFRPAEDSHLLGSLARSGGSPSSRVVWTQARPR